MSEFYHSIVVNCMSVRLLIADDHRLVNEGIKSLLSDYYQIVGQVFDGKMVLPAVHQFNPDVILLDINLPSINGFDLASSLKSDFDKLKVIFLSMYNEERFVEKAQEVKADGYLLKESTREELITGIDAVMAGVTYFDPRLHYYQNNNLHHGDHFVKQFSLTPREVEVIQLIKMGLSNPQIGKKLFVSDETIKTHRKNIHLKLGIKNVVELVEFANKNGI